MKRITRDDTEHGVEYYRADEVDSLLAQQPAQQEPVAWRYDLKRGGSFEGVSTEYSRVKLSIGENWIPLYTSPPTQREPFCWCIESVDSADWCFAATKKGVVINSLLMDEQCVKSEPFALYAAPPAQRTWVGLTDEDINDLVKEFDGLPITLSYAIEAKLKERN